MYQDCMDHFIILEMSFDFLFRLSTLQVRPISFMLMGPKWDQYNTLVSKVRSSLYSGKVSLQSLHTVF